MMSMLFFNRQLHLKMINSRNEVYGARRHGNSLKVIKKTESKFHRCRRIVEPVKHSSTDEGMKSQKGSGLVGLDYLEPYRIGTSGIKPTSGVLV